MLELNEFDFEFVAKSYSIQGVALDQSFKQRNDQCKSYEETLREYKEVKNEILKTDEQRQILYSDFAEKLYIKNSFNQLQTIPNSKLSAVQKETLELYEKISKDSDDFVNSLNTILKKIQNLGPDFDDSVITNNKTECTQKIKQLIKEVAVGCEKYAVKRRYERKHPYASEVHNVKIALQHSLEKVNATKIKLELTENQSHLTLLNKNIEFLTRGNKELQAQLQKFYHT